jgi:hypothetical protein
MGGDLCGERWRAKRTLASDLGSPSLTTYFGDRMPDDIVTADVLARWLGVSERFVCGLARKGVVVKAGALLLRIGGSWSAFS